MTEQEFQAFRRYRAEVANAHADAVGLSAADRREIGIELLGAFCDYCGFELKPESHACPRCGWKVDRG